MNTKNKPTSAYEITIRRKYQIREPYGTDSLKGDMLMLYVKVA
jgi:hypothetical protein